MNPDLHPADFEEAAEAYLMGRLSPEESTAFEDHCITCSSCAERLQAVEEFRSAIRRAAARVCQPDAVTVKIPALEPTAQL